MEKPILLSGMQPSGALHIGNYFGALKQFVELQDTYQSFFMIADYHALTSVQNSEELKEYTLNLVADYLAAGLDPEKSTLFLQSAVPQHTELTWIFNTITTMPYLMRAHAFKDAEAKNKEISVGKFDYPILMAADILLYDAEVVPVGQDQKQHIEFARDAAEKFNRIYGETFKTPKEIIPENVATIPGVDGQKMSKSYKNTIPLFAEDEVIEKQVMSIVTDSKEKGEALDPETDTIFALHKHFSADMIEDIESRYRKGSITYKESKELLAKNIKNFVRPLREAKKEILKNPEHIREMLRKGGNTARTRAEEKMTIIRQRIGITQ